MTADPKPRLGICFPYTLDVLVCVLSVFVSSGSFAERRRLSNFFIPRHRVFFNAPQRLNTGFSQFGNPFASNASFGQFNALGGLGASRFSQITGNGSFFDNRNLVDPRQAQVITNFSKIRQLGNAIIEVDQFGIGQRLFIDRNGDLIGGAKPAEARTVQQLKEFYLANRDKFRGNAKATVDRFLAKQGALSNGLFKVDLDDFALDFKNKEVQDTLKNRFGGNKAAMRRELGLAALNYLLNSLQARFKIRIPPQAVRADGTVLLNLRPFFRGEVLAIMNEADNTAACTGKIRLNKLINFTMDPDNYIKILNAPKTVKELANAYGVQSDKTLTFQNKMVVGLDKNGGRESIPAQANQRVLEVQTAQNVPGASCYRSLDGLDQPAGGEQASSRSVKTEGINFAHDAEEWLCLGGNGFIQSYIYNGQGQRLARAPANIATSSRLLGPEIKVGLSCLDCHADGFVGGGNRLGTNVPYTDRFDDVKKGPTVFRDNFGRLLNHQDFFIHNRESIDRNGRRVSGYFERAQRDSAIFRRARQETGSEFLNGDNKPFATLPQIGQGFIGNLTPENAAVELGLGDSADAAKRAEALIGGKFMTRTDFDAKYCNLIRGRNDFQNEIQDQLNLRQEQINNGNGFQFQNHLRR